MFHQSTKFGIILVVTLSLVVSLSYSSSSTILEADQSTLPFHSSIVTSSSSTFSNILPMSSATLTPISSPKSVSSITVTTSSITNVQTLSTIPSPYVYVVIGTDVTFTPIMGIYDSTIPSPSAYNEIGQSFGTNQNILDSTGSSGDKTPPSFTITFDRTEFPFSINGKHYRLDELNDISPVIIETGKSLKIQLKMYENSGTKNIQHVTLYVNQYGNQILNDLTETAITFEQGKETQISDPNNLIESAKISQSSERNKSVFDFEITFSKEIDTSDLLFRVWDAKRNSFDLHIPNSLRIIMTQPTSTFTEGIIKAGLIPKSNQPMNEEPIFSWNKFDQWTVYANSIVSDKEFLESVGINGNSVPSWIKQNNAKWVKEGKLTQQELVIALKNLKNRGII